MIAAALAGCAAVQPPPMPDVLGLRLDLALSEIRRTGYGKEPELVGGGAFGAVEQENWVVCRQDPATGQPIVNPRLIISRDCASERNLRLPTVASTHK